MDRKPLAARSSTRRWWTRLAAVGVLAAPLLLAGCSADDGGPSKRPLLPFGRNDRDESIRKQAESDSVPAARRTAE
jgi:hypothetical protein